jgi:hypothetical protein
MIVINLKVRLDSVQSLPPSPPSVSRRCGAVPTSIGPGRLDALTKPRVSREPRIFIGQQGVRHSQPPYPTDALNRRGRKWTWRPQVEEYGIKGEVFEPEGLMMTSLYAGCTNNR